MVELRPDNNDLHPPAHVDGGEPGDWSKEDDPMVEDRPPSATETPAPSFEGEKNPNTNNNPLLIFIVKFRVLSNQIDFDAHRCRSDWLLLQIRRVLFLF